MGSNRYKFFMMALLAAAAAMMLSASARIEDHVSYVVEVSVPSEAALQELLSFPLIVSGVNDLAATLHLSAAEYLQLKEMGYALRLLEVQPDPFFNQKATAYITYDELGALLSAWASAYPHLCRVQSLGQSVNGRELWAIMITESPDVPADKPVVKYLATTHGDEPLGTELCLYFAEELLEGYGTDPYITDLLERTVIWLVPLVNPDGYVSGTRANANFWDINRNFPTYMADFTETWFTTDVLGDDGREPETRNIMRWNAEVHAALSANMHTGALVVNYPYDYEPGIPSRAEAPSPDDDVFRYISLEYAKNNTPMYNSTVFPQGITNGSLWYSITGGMMDWHYRFLGVPEVTLELSVVKKPAVSLLPQLWLNNRDAMFAYVETAHIGVRGLVLDRNSNAPVWAEVRVAGREQPVFTNPEVGNYHRLLLPGTYDFSFHAEGYIAYHVDDVPAAEGPATRVNAPLSDGDLNDDGVVDGADIQMAVDAVLGRPADYDADVDGRGLSATDIQAVINRSVAAI